MGYIAAEYFAYLIVVLAVGTLLFGASATVILAKEGVPRGINAAQRLASKARSAFHGNLGLLRSRLCSPTPHSH